MQYCTVYSGSARWVRPNGRKGIFFPAWSILHPPERREEREGKELNRLENTDEGRWPGQGKAEPQKRGKGGWGAITAVCVCAARKEEEGF